MKIIFDNNEEREQFKEQCFNLLAALDIHNANHNTLKKFVVNLRELAKE